jgi:hypothetical protein
MGVVNAEVRKERVAEEEAKEMPKYVQGGVREQTGAVAVAP